MKKIILFCLMGCLLTSIFTGCGKKTSDPTPYIKAIYNLYILGDTEVAKELGLSTDHIIAAEEAYNEALAQNLRDNFAAGGITVNDTDILAIITARSTAMSRMEAGYICTMESKTSATVTILASYFDEIALDTSAAKDAVATAEDKTFESKEDYMAFVTATYVENLIAAYQSVSPSVEKKEISVPCVLTDGIWYPKNMEQFYSDLATTICGQ